MKFLKNGVVIVMVWGSKMYEREIWGEGRKERERERERRERGEREIMVYGILISVHPFHYCVQVFVPSEC